MKDLFWTGTSRNVIRTFPQEVRQDLGYALFVAQEGGKAGSAKPLKGFGGAGVLEIVEDHRGDTYRAVYTVKFRGAVYVLHCFQKKSKHGVKTDKKDIKTIGDRLKMAREHYGAHYRTGE
jgi:phage-related protein